MTQSNITLRDGLSPDCTPGNTVEREAKPHYAALRVWTLRKYGLTPDAYEVKCAAQHGVCAICLKPESGTREGRQPRLAVDHSRVTGQIRDLLCCRCNQAIGLLREDPAIMRRAAVYIERHRVVLERVPSVPLEIRGEVA